MNNHKFSTFALIGIFFIFTLFFVSSELLRELEDVNITNVLDGQLLSYNTSLLKWVPINIIDVNYRTLTNLSFYSGNISLNGNQLFVNNVSGNIGINTTTPQNTLNVNGQINSSIGYIVNSSVGFTGTCTILGLTSITVKGGIITSCS